jgi:FkbH-like protein
MKSLRFQEFRKNVPVLTSLLGHRRKAESLSPAVLPKETEIPRSWQVAEVVDALYRGILDRAPDESGRQSNSDLLHSGQNLSDVIRQLVVSDEFRRRATRAFVSGASEEVGSGPDDRSAQIARNFRAPKSLELSAPEIRRALLVGECALGPWLEFLNDQYLTGMTTRFDHVLFNNLALLSAPPLPIDEYSLQIVALPMRSVLPEHAYMSLSWDDADAFQTAFEGASERIALFLDAAMRWNRDNGILTFVTNFFVPQQNPMGRLLPRYDYRNMVYFVERLNERLAAEVAKYANAYILDIDQIAASVGKRFVQDDSVNFITHGSMLGDYDFSLDQNRIEPPSLPVPTLYRAKTEDFVAETWREICAMYKTLGQVDSVKMVIMDLDDTLWRGVLGEQLTLNEAEIIDGWPLGVIEALTFLKRRGVVLAIVSKNDEATVTRLFAELLKGRLSLDDFAFKRINWGPKVDNIAAIVREANLLPKNVVFIDDNPVERASASTAFPDLRVLGSDPYTLRRVLLWTPELQVAKVTQESARRTEMMRAQSKREAIRETLSREAFLDTLQVKLNFVWIASSDHPDFPRAFELLNKTNQFNTTGKRWRHDEIVGAFKEGLVLRCFFVEDRFTSYGLVGVMLIQANEIVQFVMSCRVFGMDVEVAAVHTISRLMADQGHRLVTAHLLETAANHPCRDLYARCEFEIRDGAWRKSLDSPPPIVPHIRVLTDPSTARPVAVVAGD